MKKMRYLLLSIFTIALLFSCTENVTDKSMLKSRHAIGESTPVSDKGVTPHIIPGENRGGNRTCEEVADYFNTSFDFCWEKIDYNEDDGTWDGEFPEGLTVTVDGIYVSFEMEGCIEIDGSYYKVAAVIVKGANAANVYYYPDGTFSDAGLAAPGDQFMVSNLTFCFVECEQEDLVTAVKVYYWDGTYYKFGVSTGTYYFTEGWCSDWMLGVNDYPYSFYLHQAGFVDNIIGEVTIENGIVTIDMNDGLTLDWSYLFVGTLDDFLNNVGTDGCPTYWTWLFNDEDGNIQTFTL